MTVEISLTAERRTDGGSAPGPNQAESLPDVSAPGTGSRQP
jgi:hypothetical protein